MTYQRVTIEEFLKFRLIGRLLCLRDVGDQDGHDVEGPIESVQVQEDVIIIRLKAGTRKEQNESDCKTSESLLETELEYRFGKSVSTCKGVETLILEPLDGFDYASIK